MRLSQSVMCEGGVGGEGRGRFSSNVVETMHCQGGMEKVQYGSDLGVQGSQAQMLNGPHGLQGQMLSMPPGGIVHGPHGP
jgi:hypothetical protein